MNNDDLRLKSVAYDRASALAIRIVNAYKYLKGNQKEFVLSKQLLRSGTSIGANVAEANGAISNPEFSAKMSIAAGAFAPSRVADAMRPGLRSKLCCGSSARLQAFLTKRYRIHRAKGIQ